MNYWIWENDRENGQAIIRGGWGGISIEKKVVDIIMDERSQGELTDNLMVMGAPPVFSGRLVRLLQKFGVSNIETFPCRIQNTKTGEVHEDYFVLNVIEKIACVDFIKSSVEYVGDSSTKIFAWEYLTLDESRIQNQLLFVLEEMPVQIIVHKQIAEALEKSKITGVCFLPQGEPK
ncbi:Imm43 family immunity protein [Leptospira interrogans serovar Szwajizak]|uniref:Imm43 family immunity protein n=1 Tax=Leptospira interrogans TaxID=173 RepID=UPI00034C5969|nr:DUF1629 domain-containing protein [Leptospira interrogans]